MPPASNVSVGTGTVVVRDGTVLLVLRGEASSGTGTWAIPGGWMEWGETPASCAERETLEETGVIVGHFAVGEPVTMASASGDRWLVIIPVHAGWVSGEPQVLEPTKCPEVRWVPFEELQDLPLLGATQVILEDEGILL